MTGDIRLHQPPENSHLIETLRKIAPDDGRITFSQFADG